MTEPKKSMIRKLFLRSFPLEIKVFRLRGSGHHQATPLSVKLRETYIFRRLKCLETTCIGFLSACHWRCAQLKLRSQEKRLRKGIYCLCYTYYNITVQTR